MTFAFRRGVILCFACFVAFFFACNIFAQTWTGIPTISTGKLAQPVPSGATSLALSPTGTTNAVKGGAMSTSNISPVQSLAASSGATQTFLEYLRLPAAKRTFVDISNSNPVAYYRDFFFGAETQIANAQDGDSFSAQFTVTPTSGGAATTITFSPINFFASYNGMNNCFVDSTNQFPPICGGASLLVLWFTNGQCHDGTWQFDLITNGSDTTASPSLTVQSQLPTDDINAISGSVYNQVTYSTIAYDKECYTFLRNPDGTLQRTKKGNPIPSAPYACDGRVGEQHFTIQNKGCLLTCNAMVATYHSYKVAPDQLNTYYNTDVNACNKRKVCTVNKLGYSPVGRVNPNALSQFAATQTDSNTGTNGFLAPFSLAQDFNSVENGVCQYGPQILGVAHFPSDPAKPDPTETQHWVTAVGWNNTEQSVIIVDPNGGGDPSGGGPTTTLKDANPSKGPYNNTIFATHGYLGPTFSFILPGGIHIALLSPAELLLTNPNGQREGIDPNSSTTYSEIPNAQYFPSTLMDDAPVDDTAPDFAQEEKELSVFQPVQGQYTLTVTGTGAGTYSMPMIMWDQNLTTNSTELDNIPTYSGLVNKYTFTFSNPFSNSSDEVIELAGGLAGNGPSPDANQFLTFASPVALASLVPAGQNNFPLIIFYGPTTDPTSFSAALNGQDVHSLFAPEPGNAQPVNIPLPNGESSLTLQINGTTSSGQTATDTVTLLFDVGGSPPSSPTNLTATAMSDTEINLAWTASTSGGVSYGVFRSTTGGFTPSSANQIASGLTGTTFADTGLNASTTYFYLVEAVDTFAPSAASNQASATTLTPGSCSGVASSIVANFNGTAVPSSDALWFSSVAKVSGLGSAPVTIFVRKSTITFTASGTATTVAVPDANLTFDPNATTATTTFNTSLNVWQTVVPSSGLAGNVFLDGAELMLPIELPGGIQNVNWTATFSSDTPGIKLNWQWAAAAYTSLGVNCTPIGSGSPNLNDLGVKPVDDNKASQYQNSDHAGTPEEYKSFVIGGGTGGGGSNFTGSYSATKSVTPVAVRSCGTNAQPPSCGAN